MRGKFPLAMKKLTQVPTFKNCKFAMKSENLFEK